MIIHIPMLKEETDPSARPTKKKTITMAQIKRSIPKNILNNRNFMSSPPQSSYNIATEKDTVILVIV